MNDWPPVTQWTQARILVKSHSNLRLNRVAQPGGSLFLCLVMSTVLGLAGCDALNPAFVDRLDPTGSANSTTLDPAPGHVVIAFVNNAQVDERLLSFLESADGGNLVLTNQEKQELRPRMRMRVLVTFTDGTSQTIEFISGSSKLIDRNFDAQSFPDLNQNDLDNTVVLCDVASVAVVPGSALEVFIPVALTQFERVVTNTVGGGITTEFQPGPVTNPIFRSLQVDDLDPDGNVTVQRNIGVRDVPSTATNPLCGSVIVIVADGVLSVPFLDGVSSAPSFDGADAQTIARIGGRFEFRVAVQ